MLGDRVTLECVDEEARETLSEPATHRSRLRSIAVNVMRERGLEPDFPADARAQVEAMTGPPKTTREPTRDLRQLPWCSIDNDDSRDLDQLSVAEKLDAGLIRVIVAIADVDAAVPLGSPCDRHALANTVSVYTPAAIFPMLPERLSTDLTSLNPDEDRIAVAVELVVAPDGQLQSSDVYGAVVRNRAKLAYHSVGDWLEGRGPLPSAAAGFEEQLRLQDQAAQSLDALRRSRGALEFAPTDVLTVFSGDTLHGIDAEPPNRARLLIENLMISANVVTATFLDRRGLPSLRRVVRVPKRWDRIRDLASAAGATLPETPDSRALAGFLDHQRQTQPEHFADLSASVLSLIGSGEYVVDPPGAEAPGHFGLAVRDYSHSTAPNRRYPDLVTQRLLKAALANASSPYPLDALEAVATRCTRQEDAAKKVERQVRKAATAMLIESRVGESFDAVVTSASEKGTYARVVSPPMEGRIMHGEGGLDVGDRVRVRLDRVNAERGYIDFSR